MIKEYKERSESELITVLLNRVFQKKRTRVMTALIALFSSVFCIRELHSGWYVMENTVFSYVLSVVLYAVAVISGAVLLSSIGCFKKWKYNTGAVVSTAALWGATAFLGVFTTLYAGSVAEAWIVVEKLLWYTAPMLSISLGIAIFTGALFLRGKRNA